MDWTDWLTLLFYGAWVWLMWKWFLRRSVTRWLDRLWPAWRTYTTPSWWPRWIDLTWGRKKREAARVAAILMQEEDVAKGDGKWFVSISNRVGTVGTKCATIQDWQKECADAVQNGIHTQPTNGKSVWYPPHSIIKGEYEP